MPIDKTINQPDGADSLGPKPPTNPVEFARWVQRPRVNPKKPKVQPEVNRSIGTDKPKRSKLKNPNNTRLPEYLRPNDGLKSAPVIKNAGSLRGFLHWFDVTIGDSLDLRKMSRATLAAFGLGWYISDSMTRDEKQAYQRHLKE